MDQVLPRDFLPGRQETGKGASAVDNICSTEEHLDATNAYIYYYCIGYERHLDNACKHTGWNRPEVI